MRPVLRKRRILSQAPRSGEVIPLPGQIAGRNALSRQHAGGFTHHYESYRLLSMTKRLQVLLDDEEYRELQKTAARERMTVAEWVRQALRLARKQRLHSMQPKLDSVREAARHRYPAGDIDDMLDDIERGRGMK